MSALLNAPQYGHSATNTIDPESAVEAVRLMKQHRLVSSSMDGLFPEQLHLSEAHRVLDIGCGPGGWVLDVAFAYQKIEVIGIDISQAMIDFASAQGRSQGLDNAYFQVMDALKPLDFPREIFDLVNARFIFDFMPAASWPSLLQECWRITRPGGVIRLTEGEQCLTNSPAFEKLNALCAAALRQSGRSFSPDGRNLGITPMLGRFLRDVGCQHTQLKEYVIDFSAGEDAFYSMYQSTLVYFRLIHPFLLKMGVTSGEEFEQLFQQASIEMLLEDFCGTWCWLSVWGEKK